MVSQEQRDKVQQQEIATTVEESGKGENAENAESVETSVESITPNAEVFVELPAGSGKKRGKKRKFRERLVYESEISPRPSIWPLALAFALVVLLMGIITNVVVIGVGVVLVFVTILGWGLERRKH